MRTIDLDGPVTYVEWPGPGERTFILVHGLGGAHLNWQLVGPGLAERGRVIALDLPGFGLSPRAGRRSTLSAQRRVLSRLIAETGSGEVILGGNSMGGGIALLQAAHEPDSVGGVVPTGAIYPWTWSRTTPLSNRGRGAYPSPIVAGGFALYRTPAVGPITVRARTAAISPTRAVDIGFRLCTVHPDRIPADLVAEHVAILERRSADPASERSFLEAARSVMTFVQKPQVVHRVLDGIRCPVLVIHGHRDRLVPVSFAEAAIRRHRTWSFRLLPGVGHAPQLEAPADWLAAVKTWLERRDG